MSQRKIILVSKIWGFFFFPKLSKIELMKLPARTGKGLTLKEVQKIGFKSRKVQKEIVK